MIQIIDSYHDVIKEENMLTEERLRIIDDCLSLYYYQEDIDICDDSHRKVNACVGENTYLFEFDENNQLKRVIKNNN